MDAEAIEITKNAMSSSRETSANGSGLEVGATGGEKNAAKGKQNKKKQSNVGKQDRAQDQSRRHKAAKKKAEMNTTNEAAKEIFRNADIQALQAELKELKQQLTKATDASHKVQSSCFSKFSYTH